jgi:hypothetical protein
MLGKIVICTFIFQLYRSYPPTETHWAIIEPRCLVEDVRGPHDIGDSRISLYVNCKEDLKQARLTKDAGNLTIRWAIYEEDCF